MAEATQYTFNFKEIAELLVKKQGLNEGIWGIVVKFGLGAAFTGPKGQDVLPTAMVPILEIGIRKQEEMTSLSVDAALVNPRKRPDSRANKKKKSFLK
ncbi:MAG: hypothetical protein FJ118_19650 [Deltaproteobacteria bacterium]|nr:hypothetical protein [Deltaproteobacteria bacterium]